MDTTRSTRPADADHASDTGERSFIDFLCFSKGQVDHSLFTILVWLVMPSGTLTELSKLQLSIQCIFQLREPYSVVQFLAERLDLAGLLDLELPPGEITSYMN